MRFSAELLLVFVTLVAGGVGLPFPEDVTLVACGVLVDQHLLGLRAALAVGIAGIVVADWLLFLFGRRYGAALVTRPAVLRLLGPHRVEAVRTAILRHGAKAVFLARFMFGFRIATFLSAGMFGVSALHFGIAQAAATLIFVPAVVTLGLLFTHQAERVLHDVGRIEHWLVLVGLLGLALFLVLRARAARELGETED